MGRGKNLYHYTLKKPLTAPTKKTSYFFKWENRVNHAHKQLKQAYNPFGGATATLPTLAGRGTVIAFNSWRAKGRRGF